MLVLSGATSGPVVPSTSGDMTLDLGVVRNSENNLIGQNNSDIKADEFYFEDWAAWKAGAEIDHRLRTESFWKGFKLTWELHRSADSAEVTRALAFTVASGAAWHEL